jgi:hypothetical protein
MAEDLKCTGSEVGKGEEQEEKRHDVYLKP